MVTTIVGIVVLLGGLIFFHEFGHYLVAKLFGVRVEVFSVGFGKKLYRKTIGETEYCLSVFPLGGYVKLMGDDPYKEVPAEDAHRAFSSQKLIKRFLIVAAGPLANLLLAFLLLMVVFWFGQPMLGTRIGLVVVDSPAWNAGLRAKDRIVELMGHPVEHWSQIQEVLKDKAGQEADVVINRRGTTLTLPLTIANVKSKNVYGEDQMVGGIKGIFPNPLASMVGISNPKSPAYMAGIRTGDMITKINTTPVVLWEDINEALTTAWSPNTPITITVQRGTDEKTEHSFSVVFPNKPLSALKVSPLGTATHLGLYSSELFVKTVTPDSPAEKVGLKPGDRLVSLEGAPLYNFNTVVEYVERKGKTGEMASLTIEREGTPLTLNVKPEAKEIEDPLTRAKISRYLIGFAPQTVLYQPEMVALQIRNPIRLISHSASETVLMTERMIVSLGKLVMGQISVKNLGGPVLIATVAGKSLNAGIIPFLQVMALISINLFLLNLFPIPILDGGHLLFFTMEAVKGKPVSLKTMEIANQMGMILILFLVGLTLFNDISRMVSH